jgi:iron complex outermembrane recepter protein
MDPPTAYVFPEAYDRIEVIKGPQSVRYGTTVAGIVRFDREPLRFTQSTVAGYGSLTAGSFGRRDFVGDVTAGDRLGYARLIGTTSSQDDYEDGAGRKVHSQYQRWSTTGILGWTPDDRTRVEFTAERSDAEAAYDDRGMDGVIFDRTGYTLSFRRDDIAPWLAGVEAMVFYNYVDHVMDNYTLRAPPMQPMVSFPDRRTVGGRLAADFEPAACGSWRPAWTGRKPSMPPTRRAAPRPSATATCRAWTTPSSPTPAPSSRLERALGGPLAAERGLRADRRKSKALDGMNFGGASPARPRPPTSRAASCASAMTSPPSPSRCTPASAAPSARRTSGSCAACSGWTPRSSPSSTRARGSDGPSDGQRRGVRRPDRRLHPDRARASSPWRHAMSMPRRTARRPM